MIDEENQAGRRLDDQYRSDGAVQVVCPNCGANFSEQEASCPYCGALNPVGAEAAYMEALTDIEDDTRELADDVQNDFKANLRGNAKRIVIIACAVAAVLVALILAVNCAGKHEERQAVKDYQARENFRAQYFDEFDRLYEAGDDDALSEYVWNLTDDPGFEALFTWEHVGYLEVHDGWQTLRSAADDVQKGRCNLDDFTWLVQLALRVSKLDVDDTSLMATLSQEEEQRAVEYRAYARQFLQDALQMSEDEIIALADESRNAVGDIEKNKLKQNLEVRLKQLGVAY